MGLLNLPHIPAGVANVSILALDAGGHPRNWIGLEEAVSYYYKHQVAWDLGDNAFTLHGGISRMTGQRSELTVKSIIAVRGETGKRAVFSKVPAFSREMLFARDRMLCAYCGTHYKFVDLTSEHVQPQSKGGLNTWTNLVTACKPCNMRKANRTPEQAKMPLLYVPYIPNLHEAFILKNRRILADQMQFLMAGVPAHSRLLVNN